MMPGSRLPQVGLPLALRAGMSPMSVHNSWTERPRRLHRCRYSGRTVLCSLAPHQRGQLQSLVPQYHPAWQTNGSSQYKSSHSMYLKTAPSHCQTLRMRSSRSSGCVAQIRNCHFVRQRAAGRVPRDAPAGIQLVSGAHAHRPCHEQSVRRYKRIHRLFWNSFRKAHYDRISAFSAGILCRQVVHEYV